MARRHHGFRTATLAIGLLLLGIANPASFGQTVPTLDTMIQGTERLLGGSPVEGDAVASPADEARQFTMPVYPPVVDGPVDVQSSEGLISLSVRDASLRQVLGALAQTQGINLIVAAPADLPVTAEFKRMPLKEVLSSLLSSTGHAWTERDGVIVVTSVAAGGQLSPDVQGRRVAVIELDFASAADLQPAVEGLLSPIGQSHFIETDPSDNRRTKEMLIVEDLDPYVARIEHYLAEADQAPRQVLIEVNLLQITLEDDQRCGVDFNALSRVSGARLSLRSAGFTSAEATGGVLGSGAASPGFFIESTGGDLGSVIEALIETTDAKTLASPRLLALSGQTSRLQIGEEIGFLTNLSTQGGGVNQEQAQFLEVGVILDVTPRITRDGRVLMQVSPEVSTGAVNPNTNAPDKQTTELDTNAMLRSGQGMIIGGLIQETDSTKISRVPFLGSLPYINPLFQRRAIEKRRTELVVALTPHVLPYADPEVHARNEHDLMRAREPLTRGPLCSNPRPYEDRLADPYHDEKRLHCFDRKDPVCCPSDCGVRCDTTLSKNQPRRLPPTAEGQPPSDEVATRRTSTVTR